MTEEQVSAALREVIDPELGIDVVDLGLVYGIEITAGRIAVRMTMTSAGCPMHAQLTRMAETAIQRRAEAGTAVDIEVVWEPKWTRDRMSAEARRRLGW